MSNTLNINNLYQFDATSNVNQCQSEREVVNTERSSELYRFDGPVLSNLGRMPGPWILWSLFESKKAEI
jgi:hypothetical protein